MYLECDLKKKNYAKNSTLNDAFSKNLLVLETLHLGPFYIKADLYSIRFSLGTF